MRIVLATPLYPPDIAEPAPYVKELAKRLAHEGHTVTLVVYARIPEQITGVRIIAVDKRQPRIVRLVVYTLALLKAARHADLLFAENGASVELPAALVSMVCRTPLILHVGDTTAHAHAQHHRLLGAIERFARTRAKTIISDMPDHRPEILPFTPEPIAAFHAYDASWTTHMRLLEDTFARYV